VLFRSDYDASRPLRLGVDLKAGGVTETVTVQSGLIGDVQGYSLQTEKLARKRAEQENAASSNVASLQRRVAGVLPVAVDVPRAGNSYRFVRPLVLDEETKVTFSYKSR